MTDDVEQVGGTGPSHRAVEVGSAAFLAVLSLAGIYGSLKVGIDWAADGPRAGFFPFYVSLILLACSIVNAISALREDGEAVFAETRQLRQVLTVLVPTAIYVVLVPYIGIYVASALLIAFFMRWFGHYRWSAAATAAIAIPAATFCMFELWFLVPLPKGPLEMYLGY
jgi:hypothetical protein